MPTSPATTAFDGLTYNSRRPDIAIPEYDGSSTTWWPIASPSKTGKSGAAAAIVSVMRTVPGSKEMTDHEEKLWGHLHVMSGWSLDIDALPAAGQARRGSRSGVPDLHADRGKRPSFYGRIVEDLIAKAMEMPEGEERAALAMMIANLLKRQYLTWNKGAVEDALIRAQLREMSGCPGRSRREGTGLLQRDPQEQAEDLQQLPPAPRRKAQAPISVRGCRLRGLPASLSKTTPAPGHLPLAPSHLGGKPRPRQGLIEEDIPSTDPSPCRAPRTRHS